MLVNVKPQDEANQMMCGATTMASKSSSDYTTTPDNVAELVALIQAGGVWGLAPAWVPRVYTDAAHVDLRTVEAKLKDKL
ncbi:hypothetical protein [Streptomyces lasiicapitis]|uniref:Uncharacterized protein n=1 Tax=Streptomyces lasiicapitis TaxID=1923961 RepID=A0ABQ2LIV5_9ACTN|nr:hypothetical protein [Streptomyces lasiicapitis]GGO35701.1 hypothetical protein GCM10012286_06740 [Streptomyces lasiicapitis]